MPPRRPLGFEIAIAALVALAVLLPGIWSYTLVDPWETHYGEVSRRMLADYDLVHTDWGDEGFRSKPVLTFWLEAASMTALNVARGGGYSGELVDRGGLTMTALRLPFVLFGVLGLVLMWTMLARLINRRLAWLALLVVGSCPFYCLVARQAIPDMLLVALMTGAMAMFILATEDGDREVEPFARIGRVPIDARHVLWLVAGGAVVVQAVYYAFYFTASPRLANHLRFPATNILLPAMMLALLALLSSRVWRVLWPLAYAVRVAVFPIAWARGDGWAATAPIAERLCRLRPITTHRQIYMLWCYALLAVSLLAKGPPALGIVGVLGAFYVVLLGRWRELYDGAFELKRGVIMLVVIALPWHFAMYLKDGWAFVGEYLFQHLLNRAGDGSVDKSYGTFEHYALQLGYGMWIWAALLPAATAWLVLRSNTQTRDGRVRLVVGLWAICSVAFFCLVQTKFHHYILPAVPALGIIVAWFLDDALAGELRIHPLWTALGVGLVLLVCWDLAVQPQRWIEMFMFRYNREWPSGEPWAIDPSNGFLALGVASALALVVLGTRFVRAGVTAVCAAGLAICLWSLHAYMPIAGTHWGMREAIRTYYDARTIYGETLVYFGGGEAWDAWHDVRDRWRFDTYIPQALQLGQPMTIHVQVNDTDDERHQVDAADLLGTVDAIGAHSIDVRFAPGEVAKLQPILRGPNRARGRRPIQAVDADRLIAWELYWRGETFWSGDEIDGWLPEMKTSGPINTKTDNVEFLKYLNDHTRAPLGRRYFVITEGERATAVKSVLPTDRARTTFEILDTTSNKFSLSGFYL